MTDVRYMSTENAFDSFTMKMRNVLEENEKKKGNSWASCDLQFLLDKLDEEINEFKEAKTPVKKANETADIANICMMLYNRYIEIWAEKAVKNHSE
jgi:hypothetical protein